MEAGACSGPMALLGRAGTGFYGGRDTILYVGGNGSPLKAFKGMSFWTLSYSFGSPAAA